MSEVDAVGARNVVLDAMERRDLSPEARLIYLTLLAWPDPPEREFPTDAYLAESLGMPVDQVHPCIRELVAAGLLRLELEPGWDGEWQGIYVIENRSLLMLPGCLWKPRSVVLSSSPRRRKEKISQRLRRQVFERDGYRCRSCSTHLQLSVDHITPESKGGTLDFDNLQTLCRSCNSRKGARV